MVCFPPKFRTQFAWVSGYGRTYLSAPPCVSFRAMKNGRPRPTLSPEPSDIRWRKPEAVQPPDDRTYSAEVTSSPSNLPHHRVARFVFRKIRRFPLHALDYDTTPIPICQALFSRKFRKNHKSSAAFSSGLQKLLCPIQIARFAKFKRPISKTGRLLLTCRIYSGCVFQIPRQPSAYPPRS